MTRGPLFEKLFEPITIGKITVKNRIVMPPMDTDFGTRDGRVTKRHINYFVERAKGGVGLLYTECASPVGPEGIATPYQLCLHDDSYIDGFRELVNAIKSAAPDVKVVLQLHHAGKQTTSEITGGIRPVAPSPIPSRSFMYPETPRELTTEEVKERIEAFAKASLRAKKAGYDAVEIHFAHGYLLHNFLSPLANKRTDEYGGFQGGLKFARELIEAVRREVGWDYTVLVRINGEDLFSEGGITLVESQVIAKMFENAGVDAIHISSGIRESDHPLADMTVAAPQGAWAYMAQAIKKVVKIPVIIVRRISDPFVAEEIIRTGKADLVSIGRQLIADPEWPRKVMEGRIDEIRPCLYCNEGCYDPLFRNLSISCTVNPAAGREEEMRIVKADIAKRVLVVGGGLAGMTAALVAAMRGHKVTLVEEDMRLGGQFKLIRSTRRAEMAKLVDYYEVMLKKYGVDVRVGRKLDEELVDEVKPDVLVVATGSTPVKPKIPGIDRPNVYSVFEVLSGRARVGDVVAIFTCSYYCPYTCAKGLCCGSGYAAAFTAELLASQGKMVYLLAERPEIFSGMYVTTRPRLLKRLFLMNVKISTEVRVKEITEGGIVIEKGGVETPIAVDTFVYAVGTKPQKPTILEALNGKIKEIYEVGECRVPGNAYTSIHSAYEVALKI